MPNEASSLQTDLRGQNSEVKPPTGSLAGASRLAGAQPQAGLALPLKLAPESRRLVERLIEHIKNR